MTRIAIIGAGLSGRLLALNLRRQAPASASVVLIDRGDSRCMGPAYSDPADFLLLNVPASRMGALASDPEHFLEWARQKGVPAGPWDFLPRSLYREYVLDLLRTVERQRASGPELTHVRAEATDVETTRAGAVVHLETGQSVPADRLVLALGNFPPRRPSIATARSLASPRYAANPWNTEILDSVPRDDTVLLIGTGQTAIDLAIALDRRGHAGRIVAISRHGVLPLPHRGFETYPSFVREIGDPGRLLDIFRAVRTHLERARSTGIDTRAVIDSLRPDTQALWLGLDAGEKRRFLRHLFRHWEIIRSRIPPQSEAVIRRMRASGQLEIIAGRIHDIVETGAALEVRYTPRAEVGARVERAGLVVNCVGPEWDYGRVDHALVKNLMRRGLIRSGPAGIGLDSLPNGAILGRDGTVSGVLYTLGSTMRGVLWETLAAPEIRVQAEQLARRLLDGSAGGSSQ
jgi:uncharacterized NAD(P)/FAD-binding protein YdhS